MAPEEDKEEEEEKQRQREEKQIEKDEEEDKIRKRRKMKQELRVNDGEISGGERRRCAAYMLSWRWSFLWTACSSSSEYSSSRAAVFTSPNPSDSPPSTPSIPGAPSGRQSSSTLIAWKASDRRLAI